MNNDFMNTINFINGLTAEDVAIKSTIITNGSSALKIEEVVETIDAEVVGVIGQDITLDKEEDTIDLVFYGTSYATKGIRYTEKIELIKW